MKLPQFSIACIVILLFTTSVHAQDIQLHFPHFAGHSYDWKLFQGTKQITVRSGEIASDGRVTLVMPEAFQDYRGMTRWMLKTGGGLDMIYVGKGFSVECLSEHPDDQNIIFTGNPENDCLKDQHHRQQIILDKLGAVNHFLQVYPHTEALYQTISKEQAHLGQQFEQIQVARADSPLYAARFGEIVDFTKGVADKVYVNPADHTRYFNDFVTHTLKFKDLYTSGHWDQVLDQWLMMNMASAAGDAGFKDRLDVAVNRMAEDDILTGFAEKAVPLLVQKGKDDLLPQVKALLDKHPEAGLSATVKGMLTSFKILTGKKGPDLMFQTPVGTQTGWVHQDILLETERLDADYTLLLFYQGECPLCEDALIDLANKYKWLTEHKVRVIAVSGDTTEQAFEKKRVYHQWPDNYCDLTGMGGTNFKSYGVLGVPTLYLLDKEGMILEKTATVDDVVKHINKGI